MHTPDKLEANHSSSATSPNYDFAIERALSLAGNDQARVLDYGCGTGFLVARARANGFDFRGVDTYAGHYQHWASKIADDADGFCQQIVSGMIPEESNSFDVVVSNQVFEHVFEPEIALSEIARVLKPGGKFLALFPTSDTWFEGHLGVYFAHWLPARSSLQLNYLRLLRRLGFGYYKGSRSVDAWAKHGQMVLNDVVVYRSAREIDRLWHNAFGAHPSCDAANYMRFRLASSRFAALAPLATHFATRPIFTFICRKRGSRILIVENQKG